MERVLFQLCHLVACILVLIDLFSKEEAPPLFEKTNSVLFKPDLFPEEGDLVNPQKVGEFQSAVAVDVLV